jgi:hypothetical protein
MFIISEQISTDDILVVTGRFTNLNDQSGGTRG